MDSDTKRKLMGKQITFRRRLYRRVMVENGAWLKTWEPMECEPTHGWIVGFRRLQNGHSTWEGEEVGRAWTQKGCVAAVLVATGPDFKHTPVPITELT